MSNLADTSWGRADYDSVGTEYREDVRRAVFFAVPLGGVGTIYRWSSGNVAALDDAAAISPSAWDTYHSFGTSVYWDSVVLGYCVVGVLWTSPSRTTSHRVETSSQGSASCCVDGMMCTLYPVPRLG